MSLEMRALAREPFLFWLIQRTIDAGVSPRDAVKWWMYIWQCIAEGKASEKWLGELRQDFYLFLGERGFL
jgi:hypothetical protein